MRGGPMLPGKGWGEGRTLEGPGVWGGRHSRRKRGSSRLREAQEADTSRSSMPNRMKNVPMALDLFSGTNSVTEALRGLGYQVVTLDSDPKTCPDICVDILQWDYRSLKPGEFDVIFAAVPCTEYSMALTTRPRNLPLADAVVRRTLEVISFLRP